MTNVIYNVDVLVAVCSRRDCLGLHTGLVYSYQVSGASNSRMLKLTVRLPFKGPRQLSPFRSNVNQTPGKHGTVEPMFIGHFTKISHKHFNISVNEGRVLTGV